MAQIGVPFGVLNFLGRLSRKQVLLKQFFRGAAGETVLFLWVELL